VTNAAPAVKGAPLAPSHDEIANPGNLIFEIVNDTEIVALVLVVMADVQKLAEIVESSGDLRIAPPRK